MRSFSDVAPERLTTKAVGEMFGSNPFAILWLSGVPVEITYQETGTSGMTMTGTVSSLHSDGTPDLDDQYEVVWTGQALVNQLVSLCKGKEWVEPIAVKLIQKPMGRAMRPMWMLADPKENGSK